MATLLLGVALGASQRIWAQLPPPPTPAENPPSEAKRVLGKILFWEEQLSSDNDVACGTCHLPEHAGADPRLGVHPGAFAADFDDVIGSPGVFRRDAEGRAVNDPVFGYERQVTRRAAPSSYGALYAPAQFWDGRAGDAFLDPLSSTIVIPTGGSLESQALGPILSGVEMAREGRTFSDVTNKLANVTPLVLARNLPPDMSAALPPGTTYPDLFDAAFGDTTITPVRIAFAIATYERSLVADQTPWDAFIAGDNDAMTASQQQGWTFFSNSNCSDCHTPPFFTNDEFRVIGVRPPSEDAGVGAITGVPTDDGRFKVPTLRNVGVKPTFMHNGRMSTVDSAVIFYQPTQLHFAQNLDPLIPISIPGTEADPLIDFVSNALTDPRVASGSFPFDRPTLGSEATPRVPALPLALTPVLGGVLVLVGVLARSRDE
jgi:cytochrome c peroxidase